MIRVLFLISLIISPVFAKMLVFPPYGHSHGIRKAKQIHLSMFLPFRRFKDPQGLATAKMISRDDPDTENDDDEVVVYGVNAGKHGLIYNTSMAALAVFGKFGSGKNEFKFPKGVACDPYGNVYVVDAGNNRVVHLFNPKKYVHWVKAFDGRENGNAQGLHSPSQVSLDSKGNIYVTDTGNRRIVMFDSTGRLANRITGDSSYSFIEGPGAIAVADGNFWSYFRKEQAIFCTDKGGKRILKLDFQGSLLKTATLPSGYTAFYAAIDYYHNLWLTDKESHCILKYDHDLNFLGTFGSYGDDDNQFIEPRGIAIWKRYGQTFIAEKTGAQYFWMGTDVQKKDLHQDEQTKDLVMETKLTGYSFVSLFYVKDQDTTTFLKSLFLTPGLHSRSIKTPELNTFKDGIFIFRLEPTYSSYTYEKWDYSIKLN